MQTKRHFKALNFLIDYIPRQKNGLMKLRGKLKKLITQSLFVCIQMEESSILTILEDQEILLEAFILVKFNWKFNWNKQLKNKMKWRTFSEI